MSMEVMVSFLEKAQSDPALADRLAGIAEQNEGEDLDQKVAALAGEHGFSLTADDVRQSRQQSEQAAESANGDLSDNDLGGVSGGGVVWTSFWHTRTPAFQPVNVPGGFVLRRGPNIESTG